MKKFFSSSALWQPQGITVIRLITAFFLVYHGWEVFDTVKMKEYISWDVFKNTSSPLLMTYLGKGSELAAGVLLFLGLLTRIASLIITLTFVYISFFVGNGKVWYEDQHPFLFVLLGLVFFFTGPGKLSMDEFLFTKERIKNE